MVKNLGERVAQIYVGAVDLHRVHITNVNYHIIPTTETLINTGKLKNRT
jgi:hypothetical protein